MSSTSDIARLKHRFRTIYRVEIDVDTSYVDVLSIQGDDVLDGKYTGTHLLPSWMQGQLAVLSVFPNPPPVRTVADIGSRMGPGLFWIVQPTKET